MAIHSMISAQLGSSRVTILPYDEAAHGDTLARYFRQDRDTIAREVQFFNGIHTADEFKSTLSEGMQIAATTTVLYNNEPVGAIHADQFPNEHGQFVAGAWIARSKRRKGIMSLAATLYSNELFGNNLNLAKITTSVRPQNQAARNLMTNKLGAVEVGPALTRPERAYELARP